MITQYTETRSCIIVLSAPPPLVRGLVGEEAGEEAGGRRGVCSSALMAEPAVAAPAATAAVFMSEQRRLELAATRETLMAVLASLPDEIIQAHAAKF